MIACPNEMFQYLLIMAATVSLPPVEPLAESPSPALLPMKNAPIVSPNFTAVEDVPPTHIIQPAV